MPPPSGVAPLLALVAALLPVFFWATKKDQTGFVDRGLSTLDDALGADPPAWITRCPKHPAVFSRRQGPNDSEDQADKKNTIEGLWASCMGVPAEMRDWTRKPLENVMDRTSHFCPLHRGNIPPTGPCRPQPGTHDVYCFPAEWNRHGLKAFGPEEHRPDQGKGAPGLCADQDRMRYNDPIYCAPSSQARERPFVNANVVWDRKGKSVLVGQCPLHPSLQKDKRNTVCEWLLLLEQKRVQVLVTLSPTHAERKSCLDYISWLHSNPGQCGGGYTVTPGTPVVADGGSKTSNIAVNYVTRGKYSFRQVFFESWPDAFGSNQDFAPVPKLADAEKVLEVAGIPMNPNSLTSDLYWHEGEEVRRVAIQCKGGRGRSGSMSAAIVARWERVSDAEELVNVIGHMRSRRADLIEVLPQLMLVGALSGLCRNEKAGAAYGKDCNERLSAASLQPPQPGGAA